MGQNFAALAVVARDCNGDMLKTWTQIIPGEDPLVAEASAIFWAHEVAKRENYQDITIEGDAKICFDTLN
jgi:hypothetical protein